MRHSEPIVCTLELTHHMREVLVRILDAGMEAGRSSQQETEVDIEITANDLAELIEPGEDGKPDKHKSGYIEKTVTADMEIEPLLDAMSASDDLALSDIRDALLRAKAK